ncbi:sensor domain-containing diguanylate cyclase [Azoarcus olearius]|uniref:sensor domain-containing diguanylate cyclase n=1 Tax=Azoarcus sp. (strain BH72) TaxID=418699 RepID=UPI0012ECF42D|nr:diguanylate cyclase [Azoarcus olearius]
MRASDWGLSAARWAIAGAIVLLVTDLLLAWVLWNERERALERGQESVTLAAATALRRAESLFELLDRTLSGVSEVVAARASTAPDDVYLHRLLLRRNAITPALVSINLIGADGRLLSTSRTYPAPPIDLSDRDYVKAQIDDWNKGLFLGSPVTSRLSGIQIVPISRRVNNDGGRLIGVVSGAIDPHYLHDLVSNGADGLLLGIFRRDGHALACLPHREECPDAPPQVKHMIDSDLEGGAEAEISKVRLLGKGRGISVYLPSRDGQFFVVADLPNKTLLASWHANLPVFLVIALGGNVALMVIGLYAYRQVTRRRQALDELAATNRELEDRVRERTRELHRLAHTDVLTGARNRRAFMDEGEALFALAHRHHRDLAVMVLDVDRFKSINDRYGHAGGDAVLRALATVPDSVLRTSDLFARFGGEEFAIVLPETDCKGAMEVGQRLLAAFRECEVPHDGQVLRFTVSIGLSVIGPADASLEALLQRADLALYRAKESGRDRLEWTPADSGVC